MTISELRHSPLSDDIVCKLLQATEAYTEMNTLLKMYPDLQDTANRILFLLDSYYWASNDNNVEIDTVIQDYFINNPNSYVSRFMKSYQSCKSYTEEKRKETAVLTAVDVVKVNHTMLNLNDDLLSENNICFDYLPCIKPFWLILHELYNPNQQYPLLLEAAISFSCFMSFAGEEKPDLPTLAILLSNVLGNDILGGLIMQWALLTDPRKTFSEMEDKNKLLHILTIFENMWRLNSSLIYRLLEVKAKLPQKLQTDCPALSSARVARLLADMICLRINDLKSELNISSKTAINHLKLLEQNNILHSLKVGCNRFYFNNIYCGLIKDLI